ncbi:MAG: hypothetical protein AAGJ08_00040 [Cyanobacteria bacterium P01_H01_bin.35]
MKPTKIGRVDPNSGIWDYLNQLPFKHDTYKTTVKRKILAIKTEIQYKYNGNIYLPGYRDERVEAFLSRIMPTWGTALVLRYEPGGKISPHRDTTGYGRTVCTVSSEPYILTLDTVHYKILANTVISFPSKTVHSAHHETNNTRLVLCCWEFDKSKLSRSLTTS